MWRDENRSPTAPDAVLDCITFQRARIFAYLADGQTLPEIAAHLGISPNGARSHVERLKALTGLQDVRSLGRWWRAHRDQWLDYASRVAGL